MKPLILACIPSIRGVRCAVVKGGAPISEWTTESEGFALEAHAWWDLAQFVALDLEENIGTHEIDHFVVEIPHAQDCNPKDVDQAIMVGTIAGVLLQSFPWERAYSYAPHAWRQKGKEAAFDLALFHELNLRAPVRNSMIQ